MGDPDRPSPAPQSHELGEFMRQVSQQLASEYTRIRGRVAEDPGTAGDEGEENWRDLFHDWLPPDLPVVTKGRILGSSGDASPQVDVLILRPGYPRSLLNKKTYLAGGVLAAFECKLTLRPEHVREAISTASAIRSIVRAGVGSPRAELRSPVIYGLLAHTTAIRREPKERIDTLLTEGLRAAHAPSECIDVLCVADLSTWQLSSLLFSKQAIQAQMWESLRRDQELGPDGGIRTFYMRWKGWAGNEIEPQPLYILIQHLLNAIAHETPVNRDLAMYWNMTAQGGSSSVCSRSFPLELLSERIRAQLGRGRQTYGDPWSPWGSML